MSLETFSYVKTSKIKCVHKESNHLPSEIKKITIISRVVSIKMFIEEKIFKESDTISDIKNTVHNNSLTSIGQQCERKIIWFNHG